MSSSKFSEKLVMMPVPVGAVPAVYELLGRYAAAANAPESISVPNNGQWSKAEVQALCRKLRNAASRAAFRRIASELGGWVTYAQMAEAAGVDIDHLRAHLAWFSKYAKQIKGENYWPLQHEEDASKPKGDHAKYRMPGRIAEWWLEADGASDDGTSNDSEDTESDD